MLAVVGRTGRSAARRLGMGGPGAEEPTMTAARELRFAFTFDDFDAAVRLFRDVLGLTQLEDFSDDSGRGIILRVPAATLEAFDRGYAAGVDRIEAGAESGDRAHRRRRRGPRERGPGGAAGGATPVADPVRTPWGDHNQRFEMDGGLQLTLFQPGDR
jgi:lactoylglutathione lyase